MQALQQLFSSNLPIPLWQVVLYIGLISYCMVQRWFKLSFLTSFILVLYWLHYEYRADLVAVTSEDHLARAIYYVFAFVLVLLGIFALSFLEGDADSLLEKRDHEISYLKALAKNAEKTAADLQAQLERDQSQDPNAKTKREKKRSGKIDKLEHALQDAVHAAETRNAEIADLKEKVSEAQKNASAFESLLEIYQTQESNTKKKLQEELNAKIEELQDQLQQSETLLKARTARVAELQSRASDTATDTLEQSDGLAAGKEKLEKLTARITELEHDQREGVILLQKRDMEITELWAKASAAEQKAATFKAQLENAQTQVSTANRVLEEELNAKIAQLQDHLQRSERLLEQRDTELADAKAKAAESDKRAAALKMQLEKDQSQGTFSKKKLEEKLNTKISKLENQLKQGEHLLGKRNTEIAELQAKASEAEKNLSSLKSQLQKDQTKAASITKELEADLSAKIEELQHHLQESSNLLEEQNVEIRELRVKVSEAEKNAVAGKAQLEKEQTQLSAAKKFEDELKGRIATLEGEVKQDQILLENRNLEITALKAKASEAEKTASTLEAQLEKHISHAASATKKVDEELKRKIAKLEDEVKQDQVLLENRNLEITALKAKASEAEKNALASKDQFENERTQLSGANENLQEEFNATISRLANQLKQSESLVETRTAELADFSAKAARAEKEIAAFKLQLEKERTQLSAGNKKLQDEYNGKIAKLESQLKESETLLKTRNSEIAALQTRTSEAEGGASAVKAQLEKGAPPLTSVNKKLGEELNAKIAKLESQLKEALGLLQSRNSEIAEFKSQTAVAVKNVSTAKLHSAVSRSTIHAQDSADKNTLDEDVRKKLHQFQYAVKYLEDEIKEKDRLLSLMAKKNTQTQAPTKNAMEEDFKKKINQLEQSVRYLEDQGKEKDGLLGLMAKRNRELADLKSKAEEKLEALEANNQSEQTGKGHQSDIASER